MNAISLNNMETIRGTGSFWKCTIAVGGGMISGGGAGFMIGTGFLPGFGTAFGTAVGLYLGGVGAGLSTSACMN